MKNISSGKSKTAAAAAVFAFFAALNFCVFAQLTYAQKVKEYKPADSNVKGARFYRDELQILALVNRERAKRGLNELVLSDDLAKIARDYSEKMARENFFSHYDADGSSVLQRAKAAHLKHWSKIGENLFSVENLARFDDFAVNNWMKSPAHKDNILDRDWTTTGVGVAESAGGEIFITQIFIEQN